MLSARSCGYQLRLRSLTINPGPSRTVRRALYGCSSNERSAWRRTSSNSLKEGKDGLSVSYHKCHKEDCARPGILVYLQR
jgi:hypothetical protein